MPGDPFPPHIDPPPAFKSPPCKCGHSIAQHADGLCSHCNCDSYVSSLVDLSDKGLAEQVKELAVKAEAVMRADPTFPFDYRDRYEAAYTSLVYDLLVLSESKLLDNQAGIRRVIMIALTRAAERLS